jgi:hypothetical protein
MGEKVFFNKFDYTNEQQLLDKLVVEAIQIYGQDMFYLPLRRVAFDEFHYDDDQYKYDTYYQFEMFVKNVNGFLGQGAFIAQLGYEINDEIIISIARTTFENEVAIAEERAQKRPLEGDMIYFPLNKKSFQIKFVDDKPFFYQFGTLQMYDCTCELMTYSNYTMDTGIPEIDALQKDYSFETFDYAMLDETGNRMVTEDGKSYMVTEEKYANQEEFDPTVDNEEIEEHIARDTANTIINWDEENPFIESNDKKF